MGAAIEENVEFVNDDEMTSLLKLVEAEQSRAHLLMDVVIPIGVALVYETNFDRLLEKILTDAMYLCSADGGALYLCGDHTLTAAIVRIDSIGLKLGGTTGNPVPQRPISMIQLHTAEQRARVVAVEAATFGAVINIHDITETDGFDLDDANAPLQGPGYRTRSCLALPLRNHERRVIGVVELTNARRSDGEISPFEPGIQQVVESLCLIASAALESYIRQQRLKDQVREMSIKIDEAKKEKQVSAIIETDYFKNLRARARNLRADGSA
jgi:GAF domain-containing protein